MRAPESDEGDAFHYLLLRIQFSIFPTVAQYSTNSSTPSRPKRASIAVWSYAPIAQAPQPAACRRDRGFGRHDPRQWRRAWARQWSSATLFGKGSLTRRRRPRSVELVHKGLMQGFLRGSFAKIEGKELMGFGQVAIETGDDTLDQVQIEVVSRGCLAPAEGTARKLYLGLSSRRPWVAQSRRERSLALSGWDEYLRLTSGSACSRKRTGQKPLLQGLDGRKLHRAALRFQSL